MTEYQDGGVARHVWGKLSEEAAFKMAVKQLALRSEVAGSTTDLTGAGCQHSEGAE